MRAQFHSLLTNAMCAAHAKRSTFSGDVSFSRWSTASRLSIHFRMAEKHVITPEEMDRRTPDERGAAVRAAFVGSLGALGR